MLKGIFNKREKESSLRQENHSDDNIPKLEEDSLDRHRLAARILTTIRSYPVEWNLRIGLFGKWGSGKSTVLDFIRSLSNPESEIVVPFNLWRYGSRDALWKDFIRALITALDDAKIRIDEELLKRLKRFVSPTSEIIRNISKLDKRAEVLIDIGGQYYDNFRNLSSKDLGEVVQNVKNKRFIVLVDDLDRAEQRDLPEILHIVKELLSIDGFVFVLAFDHDVVSKGLGSNHAGWESGGEFLEKILNYWFWIENPTNDQLKTLLQSELNLLPFLNQSAFFEIQSLLPQNPRKLKGLVRSFRALQNEIERFEAGEVKWRLLIIGNMLSREIPGFVSSVINYWKAFNAQTYGTTWQKKLDGEDAEKKFEEVVLKAFPILNDWTTQRKAWCIEVLQSLFVDGNAGSEEEFELWADLANKAPIITLRELKSIIGVDLSGQKAVDWIIQAKEEKNALFTNVLHALIELRLEYLRQAADSRLQDDKIQNLKYAGDLLECIKDFLLKSDSIPGFKLSAEHLQVIMEMYGRWNNFTLNPEDSEMRTKEVELIIDCSTKSTLTGLQVLGLVVEYGTWVGRGADENNMMSVVENIKEKSIPNAYKEFLDLLTHDGFIQNALKEKDLAGARWLFFHLESPLFDSKENDTFKVVLENNPQSESLRFTLELFLRIITDALKDRAAVEMDRPQELINKNPELFKIIWKSVVSPPLNYRAFGSLKEPKSLIEQELKTTLDVPDWWKAYERIAEK